MSSMKTSSTSEIRERKQQITFFNLILFKLSQVPLHWSISKRVNVPYKNGVELQLIYLYMFC